jgi:hypothetical protein
MFAICLARKGTVKIIKVDKNPFLMFQFSDQYWASKPKVAPITPVAIIPITIAQSAKLDEITSTKPIISINITIITGIFLDTNFLAIKLIGNLKIT